jgi:hypothetical protein
MRFQTYSFTTEIAGDAISLAATATLPAPKAEPSRKFSKEERK